MMSRIEELEKKIKELEKQTKELQHELEVEKQKTEIEYPPLKISDNYCAIDDEGNVFYTLWSEDDLDKNRRRVGNVFITDEEARRERDRRILLTCFRQFRDKCNGDWKPDFNDDNSWKYCIAFNHNHNMMKIYSYLNIQEFHLFGYFKKESDAERAIELFGDEIKRLYLEW